MALVLTYEYKVLWQFFCFHNLLPFWSLNLLLTGVVANVQHIVDADSVPIAIAGAFGMALLTVLLWLGVGRFVCAIVSNVDLT